MYCYKLFPDGEQSRINKDKDHKETFNSTLKISILKYVMQYFCVVCILYLLEYHY